MIQLKYICLVGFLAGIAVSSRADLTVEQVVETYQDGAIVHKDVFRAWLKPRRMRLEWNPGMTSLILRDRKVTFSIMDATKSYVVIPHDGPDAPLEVLTPEGWKFSGKKDVISEQTCERWEWSETPSRRWTVWIASPPEMKSMDRELLRVLQWGASPGWLSSYLAMRQGLPIRIVETEKGQVIKKSDLTKSTFTALPDSLFEVPAGYQEMKTDSMPE